MLLKMYLCAINPDCVSSTISSKTLFWSTTKLFSYNHSINSMFFCDLRINKKLIGETEGGGGVLSASFNTFIKDL